MKKIVWIGIAVAGLVVIGGLIALGTLNVPAPSEIVETPVDASRFAN